MNFDACVICLTGKPNNLSGGAVVRGFPGFSVYCDPNLVRTLRSDIVEFEGREEANASARSLFDDLDE